MLPPAASVNVVVLLAFELPKFPRSTVTPSIVAVPFGPAVTEVVPSVTVACEPVAFTVTLSDSAAVAAPVTPVPLGGKTPSSSSAALCSLVLRSTRI